MSTLTDSTRSVVSSSSRSSGTSAPRLRHRMTSAQPVRYLIALLIVAVTVGPLLFVVLGGFRTNAQLNADPTGFPSPWVLDNYATILASTSFWRFLANSMLIATTSTALAVSLGAMAAYALSRYNFRGRDLLSSIFVTGLLFPLSVAILPVYLLLRQTHLLESWVGVTIPQAAFALPVTIIILRPFMAAIPNEIEDAAMMDGAGRLSFFVRILLPLSRPALVTVSVLAFITSWNSYLLPLLVFTDPGNFTLPLGVTTFQSQYSQDTAGILAFTTLSMVPALVFFMLAERRIVGGLTGAVKG